MPSLDLASCAGFSLISSKLCAPPTASTLPNTSPSKRYPSTKRNSARHHCAFALHVADRQLALPGEAHGLTLAEIWPGTTFGPTSGLDVLRGNQIAATAAPGNRRSG